MPANVQPPNLSTLKQLAEAHWSELYSYSAKEYERFRKRYSRQYAELLPRAKGVRVLDVGCGGGYFLSFLKSAGFSRLRGVDSDQAAVEACRSNVEVPAERGEAIRYLRTHEKSFDLIVCNHVMEHFARADSIELAGALYDALAPGGNLIVTVPNAMSPWMGYYLFDDLTHDHLYTPNSLAGSLASVGFANISVHPEAPVAYDLLTGIRYVLWKVHEAWLSFCFAVDVGVGRNKRLRVIFSHGLIACANRPS
jgi:2-polyprenyl-3-methyl-5-hydroxy-6-metoxy-1,4-benzoquinol methylase